MVRTAGGTGGSFRASERITRYASGAAERRARYVFSLRRLLDVGGGGSGHGYLGQTLEERVLGLEQVLGEGERRVQRLCRGRQLGGEGDLGRIGTERVERRRGRLQRTERPALGGLDGLQHAVLNLLGHLNCIHGVPFLGWSFG